MYVFLKKRLLKEKNSEGEMYPYNCYHTDPFVKILLKESVLITSTKNVKLCKSRVN